MKASRAHVQHVLEFDFLPRQPTHPMTHLAWTPSHLHTMHVSSLHGTPRDECKGTNATDNRKWYTLHNKRIGQ